MRSILAAALGAVALTASAPLALAQAPARAPAAKAPQAQTQQPAPPPIFPCRTEGETCFLGLVVGSQVAILFTNAQNAEGIDKPVDVSGPDGAKIDLSGNAGRAVMLAGAYDPKTGIKGELVEVASPLISLSIKAQLGGAPEGPPGAPPKGGKPKARR